MAEKEVTYKEIDAFLKELGKTEYKARQNYFRWMEYPLALNLLDVKPGMKVLEVGAGYVSMPSLFLSAKKGCKVTAIDKRDYTVEDQHQVKLLCDKVGVTEESLKVMQMDAEDLEFEDGTFDRVSVISVVEHLPLFSDGKVLNELGRVVKPGGKLVITVPFSLGEHIENETWGGEEYEQRHYNDYTVRERLIVPSQLHFIKAIAFGETDDEIGKKYLKMSADEKVAFCLKNKKKTQGYWQEYYRINDTEEFLVHKSKLDAEILERAGVIAIELEKKDEPLPKSYFEYVPLNSYLENQKLCKTPENWGESVSINKIELLNSWDSELYVYESGQSMTVRITFRCYGEVINPAFFIIFQDEFGNIVAGLNTYQAGIDLGHLKGKHRFDIKFGMLNLMPGAYNLSVGAWEYDWPNPIPPYPYDVKYHAFQIKIRERQGGLFGAAYLPYQLDIKKLDD